MTVSRSKYVAPSRTRLQNGHAWNSNSSSGCAGRGQEAMTALLSCVFLPLKRATEYVCALPSTSSTSCNSGGRKQTGFRTVDRRHRTSQPGRADARSYIISGWTHHNQRLQRRLCLGRGSQLLHAQGRPPCAGLAGKSSVWATEGHDLQWSSTLLCAVAVRAWNELPVRGLWPCVHLLRLPGCCRCVH